MRLVFGKVFATKNSSKSILNSLRRGPNARTFRRTRYVYCSFSISVPASSSSSSSSSELSFLVYATAMTMVQSQKASCCSHVKRSYPRKEDQHPSRTPHHFLDGWWWCCRRLLGFHGTSRSLESIELLQDVADEDLGMVWNKGILPCVALDLVHGYCVALTSLPIPCSMAARAPPPFQMIEFPNCRYLWISNRPTTNQTTDCCAWLH
jgi:hypothetical protein